MLTLSQFYATNSQTSKLLQIFRLPLMYQAEQDIPQQIQSFNNSFRVINQVLTINELTRIKPHFLQNEVMICFNAEFSKKQDKLVSNWQTALYLH